MRTSLLALVFFPLLAHAEVRLGVSGNLMHPVVIGEGIRVTGPATQPETVQWQNAVLANGGAFDGTDIRAVDYFISQCKAQGIWPLLDWVALFAGRNLSAALVPVKRTIGDAVITNSNFLEEDFSPQVGLSGNGTNKRLLPGLNRDQCRASNDVSMGVFITLAQQTDVLGGLIGAGSSAALHLMTNTPHTGVQARVNNGTVIVGAASEGRISGFCGLSRLPTEGRSYVFSPAGEVSSTQATGVASAVISVFSRNTADYFRGSLGGAWMGGGLTSQQRSDFRVIWSQTMSMLGRPAS